MAGTLPFSAQKLLKGHQGNLSYLIHSPRLRSIFGREPHYHCSQVGFTLAGYCLKSLTCCRKAKQHPHCFWIIFRTDASSLNRPYVSLTWIHTTTAIIADHPIHNPSVRLGHLGYRQAGLVMPQKYTYIHLWFPLNCHTFQSLAIQDPKFSDSVRSRPVYSTLLMTTKTAVSRHNICSAVKFWWNAARLLHVMICFRIPRPLQTCKPTKLPTNGLPVHVSRECQFSIRLHFLYCFCHNFARALQTQRFCAACLSGKGRVLECSSGLPVALIDNSSTFTIDYTNILHDFVL